MPCLGVWVRVCLCLWAGGGVAGAVQGEPRWAAEMSLWPLFSPLLLVQVLSLASALLQLTEHLLLRYSADLGPPSPPPCRSTTPLCSLPRA